ncbi:MAG TPA: membrane protein insertase YidC [Candidatus Acidoferrum sp.]|nr:membrane protein insertase YidC [Candidatus Acidoferrum sp.]
MSAPEKKKELSSELRILIASILSMAVILLWVKFFAPKPPANLPQPNKPEVTAPASTNAGATSPVTAASSASSNKSSAPLPAGNATAISPPSAAAMPPKADTQERTIIVENALYRVEISNRGGVVKSWLLKKYKDDAKPQRVLDVVHPEAAAEVGGWPFALVFDDQQLESEANSALYVAGVAEPDAHKGDAAHFSSLTGNSLEAPAELQFTWSDGHLEVTKTFRFDHSYVVHVETSARLNGTPMRAGLAWLGGFGDLTVQNPAPVETVTTFYSENEKLTDLPYKKLEGPDKWGPGVWMGGKDYTGIEDRYFVAAFLPANGAASGSLETRYWKVSHTVKVEGKEAQEPVVQVATATASQPLALRVYVGPKDYDELKSMNPPLKALVNFGWLEIIADPLFHGLKWIHKYVPNWGWSIVILTLVINMLLFPLRISGYKTTLKMQRVAPEIKQIQDKYKKYKMNDPRKAEMNKEVMAIYSREGINPVGGCVPQLLQMPIWFGLYRALQGTIELRHAPWFGWITDLSAKDPYYILPVLMGVSMYLASKMTPMTATDPQQQAMMKFMPIGMAGMFMIIPYPSGLAVYILTSGVVGVVQQWYLNRKHPLTPPGKAPLSKKQADRSKA